MMQRTWQGYGYLLYPEIVKAYIVLPVAILVPAYINEAPVDNVYIIQRSVLFRRERLGPIAGNGL